VAHDGGLTRAQTFSEDPCFIEAKSPRKTPPRILTRQLPLGRRDIRMQFQGPASGPEAAETWVDGMRAALIPWRDGAESYTPSKGCRENHAARMKRRRLMWA